MTLGDRVLSGLRTIVLLEERTKALNERLAAVALKVEARISDHEKRLTRLETIVEIVRPDGAHLRLATGGDPEASKK